MAYGVLSVFVMKMAINLTVLLASVLFFGACQTYSGGAANIESNAVESVETAEPVEKVESEEVEQTETNSSMNSFAFASTNAGSGKSSGDLSLAKDSEFSIWRPIGSILIIVAALLLAHSFLRKRLGFKGSGDQESLINIIEKKAIDHKRSLLLVEVEGRKALLGVGPEKVESLATLGSEKDGGSP